MIFVDSEIKDLELTVGEGESLTLNFANFETFKNTTIKVRVKAGASLNAAFADFATGEGTFKFDAYLENGASFNWHLASLAAGNDRKVFDVSAWHEESGSSALVSNYGICKDSSKLTFCGVSDIVKGAKKSKTRQEAKIIVFDKGCDGKASPSLNIAESDVEASHAAIVGRLNDEHIFYLLSRGLALSEARKLITLGYLRPIVKFFEEELAQKIDSRIEEGL